MELGKTADGKEKSSSIDDNMNMKRTPDSIATVHKPGDATKQRKTSSNKDKKETKKSKIPSRLSTRANNDQTKETEKLAENDKNKARKPTENVQRDRSEKVCGEDGKDNLKVSSRRTSRLSRIPKKRKSGTISPTNPYEELKHKYHLVSPDQHIQHCWHKIKDYDFRFENLSFEGGGAKLVGYIGTVQVSIGESGNK